jgi:hypothetical protein
MSGAPLTLCASILESIIMTLKEVLLPYVLAKMEKMRLGNGEDEEKVAKMIIELAIGQSMIGARPEMSEITEIKRAFDEFMEKIGFKGDFNSKGCGDTGLSLFKINLCRFIHYYTGCTSADELVRLLRACSALDESLLNFKHVLPTRSWQAISNVIRDNVGKERKSIMSFIQAKRLKMTRDNVNELRMDVLLQCDLIMSVFAGVSDFDKQFDKLETSSRLIEALRHRGTSGLTSSKSAEFNYIQTFFKKSVVSQSMSSAGSSSARI